MINRLKLRIVEIHKSLLPNELTVDKRKRILFYISFYFIFASTFFTVLSQLPIFTSRGLTQLFQFGWIISFIPLVMLDYKQVLRYLAFSLILISPFILYCLISLIFGIDAFNFSGTTHIFLCLFLLIIFGSFSKYKNTTTTKLILVSFLAAAIIYAGIVFLTKLRGQDISDQIYAFGDKNSAGPIFMSAAIIAFYLFSKRNAVSIVLKWTIIAFFVVIIALSKTRSVLITIPIILFIFLFRDINNNNKISFFVLLVLLLTLILIFTVPTLRETIIVNIFLNGKTDVDSIFSGRLTQIVVNMQNFKPVLGTGGSYFDVMILSFLCSYGTLGFLMLLPFLVFPFFILFAYRSRCLDKKLKTALTSMIIVFITSSLLEGFGYIGTGAKVFIFWFFVGNYSIDVYYSFKNKLIAKPIIKGEKIINRVPKNGVVFSIATLLFLASIITISVSSISYSIGKTVVDRLPSSNKIADYVEVKDIQIDSPVESMCVGQQIKYGVKADPINAEDMTVQWSTGWISNPCISVDSYTGVVNAKRSGSALLHINRFRVGPNGVYIQYPVVEASQYTFDKFYISQHQFHYSFEHSKDETISLGVGCTSTIFHDEFYLPDTIEFDYVSSNNNVAIVDDNLIKAIGPGECEIYAMAHGKIDTESANKIYVKVVDEPFIPVTDIGLVLPDKIYQHQEYNLEPTFNIDASDRNFEIEITGQKYWKDGSRIKFTSFGEANITVISENNKNIKREYSITVIENMPSYFECLTKRMIIGETKNAAQLGLYLVFTNGYKKIVNEDDIVFDPYDFTNRAWSNQNGLVKNRTTVKAVKTGEIKISYVSKINPEITGSFKIISSVYSEKEYNSIVRGVGVLAVTFVLIISLLFTLFVPGKRKWIIYVADSILCVLFIVLSALLYGVNSWFITSCVLSIIALIIVILILIFSKKKTPYKFLEDPVDIEYKKPIILIAEKPTFDIEI